MKKAPQAQRIQLVPVRQLEAGAEWESWTEIRNRIARRAYEIFEKRGKVHGHDLEDWFKAESQILSPVPVAVNETEHLYTVTVDVSGFNADELDVRSVPFRIFIMGRHTDPKEIQHSGESKEVFKMIPLCNEIETNTVIAELDNGQLTISIHKAPAQQFKVAKHLKTDLKGLRTRSAQLRKRADIAMRYAAAAKDQLQRAKSKERKARTQVIDRQEGSSAREEDASARADDLPDIQPSVASTEP